MQHGRIVFIRELGQPQHQQRPPATSVRVLGKVHEIDTSTGVVVIEHKGSSLRVDAKNLDHSFKLGSLYQFIGELSRAQGGWLLNARVVRNVDGMDVDLYEKSVEAMRVFEADQGLVEPQH